MKMRPTGWVIKTIDPCKDGGTITRYFDGDPDSADFTESLDEAFVYPTKEEAERDVSDFLRGCSVMPIYGKPIPAHDDDCC